MKGIHGECCTTSTEPNWSYWCYSAACMKQWLQNSLTTGVVSELRPNIIREGRLVFYLALWQLAEIFPEWKLDFSPGSVLYELVRGWNLRGSYGYTIVSTLLKEAGVPEFTETRSGQEYCLRQGQFIQRLPQLIDKMNELKVLEEQDRPAVELLAKFYHMLQNMGEQQQYTDVVGNHHLGNRHYV